MREIKYRIWDTIDGMMWEWAAVIQFGFKILTDPAYIPLQYTGLKDKKGREIYEGDIIDFGHTWLHPRNELVEWPDGNAGFSPFVYADEAEGLAIFPESHQCEVIGNIYENPELLKEAKE